MEGDIEYTGGLTKPCPCAEKVEPIILIQVGLPCLKRGHLVKNYYLHAVFCLRLHSSLFVPVQYTCMLSIVYK